MLLGVALALGGCGSATEDAGGGGSAASDDGGASNGADDTNRVRFAQCLREHGVDVGDAGRSGGARRMPSQDDLDKIRELSEGACKDSAEGAFGNISDEQRQEFADAAEQFSQCMRDNGVDLPSPDSGGPDQTVDLDQDDPEFQKAQEACRDKLPQGGFRGAR